MGLLQQIYQESFTPEGLTKQAVMKRAAEILGKDPAKMTDVEVEAKLAEICERNGTMKLAEEYVARGRLIAQGFRDKLAEEKIDLAGIHEKLAALAAAQGNGAS